MPPAAAAAAFFGLFLNPPPPLLSLRAVNRTRKKKNEIIVEEGCKSKLARCLPVGGLLKQEGGTKRDNPARAAPPPGCSPSSSPPLGAFVAAAYSVTQTLPPGIGSAVTPRQLPASVTLLPLHFSLIFYGALFLPSLCLSLCPPHSSTPLHSMLASPPEKKRSRVFLEQPREPFPSLSQRGAGERS